MSSKKPGVTEDHSRRERCLHSLSVILQFSWSYMDPENYRLKISFMAPSFTLLDHPFHHGLLLQAIKKGPGRSKMRFFGGPVVLGPSLEITHGWKPLKTTCSLSYSPAPQISFFFFQGLLRSKEWWPWWSETMKSSSQSPRMHLCHPLPRKMIPRSLQCPEALWAGMPLKTPQFLGQTASVTR